MLYKPHRLLTNGKCTFLKNFTISILALRCKWAKHSLNRMLAQLICLLALIKNEIVMNIENMNMPPKPYSWSVRRPVRSINGIETSVISTCKNMNTFHQRSQSKAVRSNHYGADAYR